MSSRYRSLFGKIRQLRPRASCIKKFSPSVIPKFEGEAEKRPQKKIY
jgi:hypothetical protein